MRFLAYLLVSCLLGLFLGYFFVSITGSVPITLICVSIFSLASGVVYVLTSSGDIREKKENTSFHLIDKETLQRYEEDTRENEDLESHKWNKR